MTGYFVYRLEQPKRAYFYLFSGILLGFMMGWAQMMRGAHFLSHNLWTGWVVWAINILFYAICIHRFEFETSETRAYVITLLFHVNVRL